MEMYIEPKIIDNMGMTVYVEQINRELARPLKSSQLFYIGPAISSLDLGSPKGMTLMVRISQTINLPDTTGCQHYPTSRYERFGDCDREDVYKTSMKIL